jgi:protein-S-isoprenylcysteine O-methyltransferase Ste14
LFLNIGKGTPFPNLPPKKLVVKGIYNYTRNPIFISYVVIFLSLFLILGHFLLLVYFILSIPFVHVHVIFIEEPPLRKRFGKSYLEYTKKVPRWFLKK